MATWSSFGSPFNFPSRPFVTTPLSYLMGGTYHTLEWIRVAGDLVFLIVGAVPLTVATMKLVLSKETTETA